MLCENQTEYEKYFFRCFCLLINEIKYLKGGFSANEHRRKFQVIMSSLLKV